MKSIHAPVKHARAIVATGMILAAATLSLWVLARVSKVRSGVCIDSNNVLDDDALRRQVLRSLVGNEVANARHRDRTYNEGTLRIGVIKDPSASDIRTRIRDALENDRSFEENFQIELLATDGNGIGTEVLEEPFTLVSYETRRGGVAMTTASADITRIKDPRRLREECKVGIYDQYRGFGTYYYRIHSDNFKRDCCDSKTYGAPYAEYQREKRAAYVESQSLLSGRFGRLGGIVMVSNCGELMTTRSRDGFNYIKWIRGE